ncbi:hypothetical protein TNCV_3502021 [Trichonephila clavipes]|uniref:Uncharacterized protein n=1 Tax=Trichonephila clavipes TaxID=2585209 RepID=A0A8X6S0Q2_TRICX|nr:hypothetical protein TNCV_3502021 [Trichonephila clavipes]
MTSRSSGIVVRDADCRVVGPRFESRIRHGYRTKNWSKKLHQKRTCDTALNSRRVASPLPRMVEGEERFVAPKDWGPTSLSEIVCNHRNIFLIPGAKESCHNKIGFSSHKGRSSVGVMVLNSWRGRGSQVVKITDSWPACHEFEPGLLQGVTHVEYVEPQTSSHWCSVEVRRGCAISGVVFVT